MSIAQRLFGVTPNGEKVTEYTMTNRDGASVSILDFGGIVTRILVPDRDGKLDDVSLSFDDIDVYAKGLSGSMGMLIGRVGNRIRGASFELEGHTYTLPKNDNGNCLHGGVGFGLRMWQARSVLVEGGDALELTLTSQDGDQGFPGTLKVKVTYTFTDHNELGIHYQASTDQTTLCNLIARFWDVQEGKVLLGGQDVKEFTADSLMSYISMVFQNVFLFHDTIENNIRFGNPSATEEEVIEAAKRAQCHEFICALPDGYRTMVGEGGSTLSGGEKQRISIARAILKNAPIVILDEATSSVDPENERELLAAIGELTRGKTLISIAHRLTTVRNADQILVIDHGRVSQKGTHEELIQEDGIYREFWKQRETAIGWTINTK